MREFVIRAIINKPVIVIERGGEILAELKRHGNNLNQAVRNNHYGMGTNSLSTFALAQTSSSSSGSGSSSSGSGWFWTLKETKTECLYN